MSESIINRVDDNEENKNLPKICKVCGSDHSNSSEIEKWRFCEIRLSKSLLGDQLTTD